MHARIASVAGCANKGPHDSFQRRWPTPPRDFNTQPVVSKIFFARQRGIALTEVMIAALLSLVVSATAINLISSSMGNHARIIDDTRLANELRHTMQMMARDVRRAGYTSAAMWCLAGTVCVPDASVNLPVGASLPLVGSFELPGGIHVAASGDCFTFETDRDQNGTISPDEYGAYRRRVADGVGVMEVWLGQSAPDCIATDPDWVALTDNERVNVISFQVDDDQSLQEVVSTDLLGNTTSQRIRRVRLRLQAQLVADPDFEQYLETTIDVRNDIML